MPNVARYFLMLLKFLNPLVVSRSYYMVLSNFQRRDVQKRKQSIGTDERGTCFILSAEACLTCDNDCRDISKPV